MPFSLVSDFLFKAQGDWRSLSYLDYFDTSNAGHRAEAISNMY